MKRLGYRARVKILKEELEVIEKRRENNQKETQK